MPESHSRPLAQQMAQAVIRMLAALAIQEPSQPRQPKDLARPDDPAVTDLVYRGLRHWGLAQVRLKRMAQAMPPPPIQALLAIAWAGLHEHLRPDHVVVSQAVEAAKKLKAQHQSNFVNALLRKTIQNPHAAALDAQDPVARFNAPRWWIERIGAAHPVQAKTILAALSSRPPLTVRVEGSEKELLSFVAQLDALGHKAFFLGGKAMRIVPPMPVENIPGFEEGKVSVQDAAAQRALDLFDDLYARRQPGQGFDILDACAAPGGKAIGLAQRYQARVWAMDSSAPRLARLNRDLPRVAPGFKGEVIAVCADVCRPQDWPALLKGRQFDAVLLDAPCTASGVARRHPEIPWKRTARDIDHAAQIQHRMLDSLWPRVKPGGELAFVTCSVFPEEGEVQQQAFLARTPDARQMDAPGRLLPSADAEHGQDHDGFFYARFSKQCAAQGH